MNPSSINFRNIIQSMDLLAQKHKFINSFGMGDTNQIGWYITQRDKQDNPTFESPIFPLYFVVPSRVENNLRFKTWEFNNVVMDIVERDLSNQTEVLSDTLQTLQDIMSQFRLSVTSALGDYNKYYFLDDTVNCTPFMEKYQDRCNGWNALMRIKTTTPLDRCSAAFATFTGTPIVHDWINLKTIKEDFQLLATYHKQINSFGFGSMDELIYWTEMRDKEENVTYESPIYPLLYVIPTDTQQVIVEDGSSWTNFQFNVMVLDIIKRDLSNQIDVLSDTNQMLDDIISQFRLSVTDALGNFNEKYYLDENVNCVPFIEKFDDLTGGWNGIFNIKVMTPLNRCDAAFDSFITPTPTLTPTNTPSNSPTPSITPTNTETPTNTPTETPTNTPTVTTTQTPTNTLTPTNTETPTSTPTETPTETPTNTPTQTSTQTPTVTTTQTPSQTATQSCPITTQYLEVQLSDNTKFKLILWNQPNFTSPAVALCDYIISGCAYGSLGTVYCGTETIDVGKHQHQFDLKPVFLPGESVIAFDVLSYTASTCACPLNLILPVGPTPTPTITPTNTPTITNTQTPTNTSTVTPSITATNTSTPTQTPTLTPTPSPTSCICFPSGNGFDIVQGSVNTIEHDPILGRIYVGGNFNQYSGNLTSRFIALDSITSNPLPQFTGTTTATPVWDIKIQSDNKILIAGDMTSWKGVNTGGFGLIRVNTDGTRDTSFTANTFSSTVFNIFVESTGKLMIGGQFTTMNGTTVGGIVRLNSDGTIDNTFSGRTTGFAFGGGAFNGVQEIISDGGTGYYVSGNFTSYNGTACSDVVRLTSNGTIDSSFNATGLTGTNRIISIDRQPSTGNIIVGNYNNQVAALNTGGTVVWTTNLGFIETNYVVVQNDNKIMAGGRTVGLFRLNSNGTLDSSFTAPTFSMVNQPQNGVMDIVIDSNNSCYIIGGTWTSLGGFIGTGIVRLFSNGNLDQCNPVLVSQTPTPTQTRTPSQTPTNTPTPTRP